MAERDGEDQQTQGIGARLVRTALELATAESASVLLVDKAAVDAGSLRSYEQAFRMRTTEQEAFTRHNDNRKPPPLGRRLR